MTKMLRIFLATTVALSLSTSAVAQFRPQETGGSELAQSVVQRWRAGMIISAGSAPCRGVVGTAPIPTNWPEQKVTIIEEDYSPSAQVSYRMVDGGVQQMVASFRYIKAGTEAKALVVVEVTRYVQTPPEDPSIFVLPPRRKIPPSVLLYLGPSPSIESTNSRFRLLHKEITEDLEGDWNKIEAIYDYVQENVQYKEGPMRGALAALRAGAGDEEDLTNAFIAICRAGSIPARTVWVTGHCYPEFYLEDAEGEGHWFPCQVAGSRAFGEMPDARVILEKGDNFRVPNFPRERRRYLPEALTGIGGSPRPKFIRELVSE